MDPRKQKVRFNFERLELRDTPAQLGVNVTLPQLPADGPVSDPAEVGTTDVGRGGSADVKLDPTSLVRVKLDPAAANVKLDPVGASVKLDPAALVSKKLEPVVSVKLDPAVTVSVKIDAPGASVKLDTDILVSKKI